MPDLVRVVADANVFVSAIAFGGKPALVLNLVRRGQVLLLYSALTRDEIEEVLARKFRWSEARIRAVCGPYWHAGIRVDPGEEIAACADPDDNRVLECAVGGGAAFIVTGDKHLLRMENFRGCQILTPDAFLHRFDE
jgi:putative PIN family toxin of toxin-antitoxin system